MKFLSYISCSALGLAVIVTIIFSYQPKRTVTYRTTHPDLAARKLSSSIDGYQKYIERHPERFHYREKLVSRLLTRTAFLGTYEDFDAAYSVAEKATKDFPNNAKSHFLMARVLQALHRFEEAREQLDKASRLGFSQTQLESLRASLDFSTHKNQDKTRLVRKRLLRQKRSLSHLSDMAAYEAQLGNYAKADSLYEEALQTYPSVSPFAVAWVLFQRGVMWAELAGQPKKAVSFYREAIERFPRYVVANVHLAELEAEFGQLDMAIERLYRILPHTTDPEPHGLLSELLEQVGEIEKAQFHANFAKTRYEQLLSRHEAAFRDHAAEFFMGPGSDPYRAFELALDNLQVRKNERAYLIALEAALLAQQVKKMCALSQEAVSMNPKSVPLQEFVSQSPC